MNAADALRLADEAEARADAYGFPSEGVSALCAAIRELAAENARLTRLGDEWCEAYTDAHRNLGELFSSTNSTEASIRMHRLDIAEQALLAAWHDRDKGKP